MRARQRPLAWPMAIMLCALVVLTTLLYPLAAAHAAGPARTAPQKAAMPPVAQRVAVQRIVAEGPSGAPVPYYVVGQPVTSQREYLFEIAEKTLGDGDRYPEIFALNKDRVQPDGGRLTDPTVVQPGWILRLPPDASGASVRFGPLPTAVAAIPTVSVAQPSITAAVTAPEPPAPKRDAFMLIRVGALVVMVGLLILALLAMRAGRRARAAHGAEMGVAPSSTPALPAATTTQTSVAVATTVTESPATDTSGAATPRPGGILERARRAGGAGKRTSERAADHPTGPAYPADQAGLAQPPGPGWATAVLLPDWSPSGAPAPATERKTEPIQPLPRDWRGQTVEAELRRGGDPLTVRLTGARMASHTPAYTWLKPDDPLPSLTLPVILGENGSGRLCVDLALAPDVLTVTGPQDVRQRLARDFAGQLSGIPAATLTVVGGALGDDTPAAIRLIGALAEFTGSGGIDVLFCAGSRAELAEVRRLLTRPGQRLVPIIVGDVPPSRWSVRAEG